MPIKLEAGNRFTLGVFDINPLLQLGYVKGELNGTTIEGDVASRKRIYYQKFAGTYVGGGLRISRKFGDKGSIVPTLGIAFDKAITLKNHITAANPIIKKFAVPVNYHVHPRIEGALNIIASNAVTIRLSYTVKFDDGIPQKFFGASMNYRF